MKSNRTYETGYSMGYDWVAYEGGNPSRVVSELRARGASPRQQWGVAFMQGARDAAQGLPRKYN